MSAFEPDLMAQLVAEPTPAERALEKIVSLFKNNYRMSCHELRVLEIVLEGQCIPPAQRRVLVEAAIQRKRDWLEARRTTKAEADDAP